MVTIAPIPKLEDARIVAIIKSDPRAERYYWLYAFLRLVQPYYKWKGRPTAEVLARVYDAWGNVNRISFQQWWKNFGVRLAGPWLEPFVAEEITSPGELKRFGRLPDHTVLVAVIHAYAPRRQINAQIRELLATKVATRVGRPKWDNGLAEYPMEPWPHRAALNQIYKVMVVKLSSELERRDDERIPALGIAARAEIPGARGPWNERTDPKGHKRREIRRKLRRYIRRGEAIIDNAANGRFPKYPGRGG